MAKKKQDDDTTKLLDVTHTHEDTRYTDKVFFSDKHNAVIATNGKMLLASRKLYPELKTLARFLDSPIGLARQGDQWIKTETDVLALDSLIESYTSRLEACSIVSVTVPEWIKGISKREKNTIVSFVLGENPYITLDSRDDGISIDLKFLRQFAGEVINVAFPEGENGRHCPIVILPESQTFETAQWFSLIMPTKHKNGKSEYVQRKK